MKFSDFLIESNVNALITKTSKVVFGLLEQSVLALYKKHAFKGMFSDGDELQKFIDTLKPETKGMAEEYILLLEKEFAALAKAEVESRFGKISPYHEVMLEPDMDASWKKLWWVGRIFVWLEDKGNGLGSSGYFQSSGSATQDAFPKRIAGSLDLYREGCVGINVAFSHKALITQLNDAVIERVVNSGDLDFDPNDDDRLKELLHNIVDTFAHEVTHLLQYTKQTLTTRARNVEGHNVYAKKNYLSKKLKTVGKAISAESSSWSETEWEHYLANAIEIDAHAVSVAAKILQDCKSKHASHELGMLRDTLEELKAGYIYSSKSFDFYSSKIQAKIEKDKRYQTVWRRFLKKIAAQLSDRIEELQKQVTAEEAMYAY